MSTMFANSFKTAAAALFVEINQPSLTTRLSPVFLRHNCPCGQCHHPSTHEKIVCSSQLTEKDTEISHLEIVDGHKLRICWDSDHVTEYPTALLNGLEHDDFELAAYQRKISRNYLNDEAVPAPASLKSVSIDASHKDSQLISRIFETVESQGFCVVTNYGQDNDALMHQLGQNGYPL